MKKLRILALFFFWLEFLFAAYSFAQHSGPQHREWPALKIGEHPVCHLAYCLLYSEKHEQAVWVAYELTASETLKAHERTNKFLEDPAIATGSASNEDYFRSGFDRGHLAPAADMGWSQQAMEESFFFSNMSPQRPQCNRGIWKKGEELVRDWARQYGRLYVITGPVLRDGLPSIGPNQVSIPEFYYKVLFRPDSLHPQAIALLVPNEGSSGQISSFAVKVDSIEALTGLDFFPWLPDGLEKKLEGAVCHSCWEWNAHASGNFHPEKQVHESRTNLSPEAGNDDFRCHGITKKGARCKRKVRQAGGFCYQHGA
jgi:endonuclease G